MIAIDWLQQCRSVHISGRRHNLVCGKLNTEIFEFYNRALSKYLQRCLGEVLSI